jgi:hypothetical protein
MENGDSLIPIYVGEIGAEGARIVRVETPNGETSLVQSTANTLTVNR